MQIQRPLRGSRISSFYPIKNLPSLASLDSAFQLQEYISLLIRLDVHDVDAIVSLPGKKDGEGEKDKEKDSGKENEKHPDDGTGADDVKSTDGGDRKVGEIAVDEACWIYEQLRCCPYVHSRNFGSYLWRFQASRTRLITSTYHNAATGMHTSLLS